MSIKNIFDKVFYLEDVEEEQAPAQAAPTKQAQKAAPQEVHYQEAVQHNCSAWYRSRRRNFFGGCTWFASHVSSGNSETQP